MSRHLLVSVALIGMSVLILCVFDRAALRSTPKARPVASAVQRGNALQQQPIKTETTGPLEDEAETMARLRALTATGERPTGHQEVIWQPASDERSPFSFIPTDLTTQPELLPGTWDAETVYASAPIEQSSIHSSASVRRVSESSRSRKTAGAGIPDARPAPAERR